MKGHDRYEALHLYPVNYSVASNQDIFELVRYDLLKQILLGGKVNWGEINVPMVESAFESMDIAFQAMFYPFVMKLRRIGGGYEQVYEQLEDIRAGMLLKSKRVPHQHKREVMALFRETELTRQGSLYEYDYFTRLLEACLVQLKGW